MESENQNSQTNTSSTRTRGKTDPAWEHFSQTRDAKGKVTYKCLYCTNEYKGGGINRMKYHLTGIKGQIGSCTKVGHDVQVRMKELIQSSEKEKDPAMKRKRSDYDEDPFGAEMEEDEVQEVDPSKQKMSQTIERGKTKPASALNNLFPPRTSAGSQPSIKSVFAGKEAKFKAQMAICRWLYDACIPFNATNSPYFQPALDAIAAIGPGFKGPSYYDVRVNFLSDCKKECALLVDSYRSNSAGTCFVKSIDASDAVKDATILCDLFSEVIEWVGPSNIVQVVTDNAANYVAAGRLIHEKYANIYWSPCGAHCINLILKDIDSMRYVDELASRASKVTMFAYNHIIFLSWLRKREGWREIVLTAATRFATTFITLKSVLEHKLHLQALVTNKLFTSHKLSKTPKGKNISSTVLDKKFWDDCEIVTRIVGPLVRLLRIVDSDERPSLPYIYDGIRRARKVIKHMFKKKSSCYDSYIKIIDDRWDKHFKKSLHGATYFLNPSFLYGEKFCKKPGIMCGLFGLLENKSVCEEGTKAMLEIHNYRDRIGSFGRESALIAAKAMRPDEWWKLFGGTASNLQKLAIRILSQTASSSGCERNWSLFERIHTKNRNRLEHQRLNDLVYVNCNLRLKNRHLEKRNFDPIDYESIEHTDFWIEEEEPVEEVGGQEGNIEYVQPIFEKNMNVYEEDCNVGSNLEDIDLDSFDPFV